jgi:DNA (cytosine-5)-methyltransferase 1
MTLRLLDTFSGIGGFSYAAERIVGGFETVAFVEREPYCQQILGKHWPNVPIYDDITTFSPEPYSADVVCGGFPCQDISTAGKQAGIKEGTRSGLFYELIRVVRLVRPRYVVLENVAAIVSNGLDTVLGELAEAGFDCEWACIPASAVGACHRRDRWWLVAYPSCQQRHDGGPADPARAAGAASKPRDGDGANAAHPNHQDWKDGSQQACQNVESNGLLGREIHRAAGSAPTGDPMYLNPSFVEEMMGFPVGWTALKP